MPGCLPLPSRKKSNKKSSKTKKSSKVVRSNHPTTTDNSSPLQDVSSASTISATSSVEIPPTINNDNSSTAALIRALIPTLIPIIRKAASKRLVDNKLILQNEEPVLSLDESDTKNYPIGTIAVHITDVMVVDSKTLKEDMDAAPSFEWPEQEHYKKLMNDDGSDGDGNTMLVLDLIGFESKIHFGPGVELNIPLTLPGGIEGNIEIGCGGKIQDPWVQIAVPKLRVWFVNSTTKSMMYAAFMDKPDLTPYLQVNADRGKGDFLDIEITEKSSVDGIVETVLAGFGPKFEKEEIDNDDNKESEKKDKEPSWLAKILGNKISQALEKNLGAGGHQRPLEVDVSEMMQDNLDLVMGKPRRVELLEANIANLEKELELARALEKQETSRRQNMGEGGVKKEETSGMNNTEEEGKKDEVSEQSNPHRKEGKEETEEEPSQLENVFSGIFCCYDANYSWG